MGNLARPGERGPTRLPALLERSPVDGHLRVRESPQHRPRQHALHEDVALEHHLVARGRAESLEYLAGRVRPLFPGDGHHDRLHVRDALDGARMAVGPVEAERRAPVVDHERHVAVDAERLEQGVEVLAVLDEACTRRGRSAAACPSRPCRSGPARCSGRVLRGAASRCATGTTRSDCRAGRRSGRRCRSPRGPSAGRARRCAASRSVRRGRSSSLLFGRIGPGRRVHDRVVDRGRWVSARQARASEAAAGR